MMMDETGSVSAALMHLFYYQQGLFAEDEEPGAALREAAGDADSPEEWPGVLDRGGPMADEEDEDDEDEDEAEEGSAAPNILAEEDSLHLFAAAAGEFLAPSLYAYDANRELEQKVASIHALRARRAELQRRLEARSLHAEHEALESKVVRLQSDLFSLQEDIKDKKGRFGEELEALRRALEQQQAITFAAEQRVICTEDLVRFHEEQRRLMAGHWRAQCQQKDECIRNLNLQLTAYTVDWQHLGAQKQTEASLSHELECLEDRHRELHCLLEERQAESQAQAFCCGEASSAHAELRTSTEEVQELDARADPSLGQALPEVHPPGHALRELHAPWRHRCIWRDELDVREHQLEKITAQLDRTNCALHSAQTALAQQWSKHKEMKAKHREAEAILHESERRRALWQRRCFELRKAEAELKRVLEVKEEAAASGHGFSPSDPRPTVSSRLGPTCA